MKNGLLGIFGMIFMPATVGGALLKVKMAELGMNPYSVPFKALKAVAKDCYELAKFTKSNSLSGSSYANFLESYVSFLSAASYAIVDYCTKPFEECNPQNDRICRILRENGIPPLHNS